MFKHLLSSIGFNGMTVDTLVARSQFDRHEHVTGIVRIERDDHHIDHIELTLIERVPNHDETSEFATYDRVLEKLSLTDNGDDIPFSFPVPARIQSLEHEFVIMTQLFIDGSVDASDEDYIQFI
ncbi:sporulation protein [Macrococcus equipercicus]|uniref:Sporulation protein n=1 Tax=Macrococcus equipercicus TaxID=69967 RepID=A0A9Q9BNF2_9STAP|nr:sporulation protein [Macrococcus equipercicus]KAA1040275.1 hypothetical protein ERX35_004600 [Macrococcus equipercicus]UTH12781.1 sporulation protein [Macrococcus equipercicus]